MTEDTITLDAPTTAAAEPPIPTVPGTPFGGGFYVGRLRVGGVLHALIVAPKAEGEAKGAWHADGADVPGARDCADGLANTTAMAAAGSALAIVAANARIGGFSDWHIPARDALELMYRHLKPTTDENYCSFRDGDNASSEPAGYPYEEASPAQTTAEAFRDGGPQALSPGWHWSSTQSSRGNAYVQDFRDGFTHWYDKADGGCTARLVRSIPIR